MKKVILLAIALATPTVGWAMEGLARALREVALSGSDQGTTTTNTNLGSQGGKDYEFDLSKIDLKKGIYQDLYTVSSGFYNTGGTVKDLVKLFADHRKNVTPISPIFQCNCETFGRPSTNTQSIRTSYEQFALRKLVEKATNKGEVAYASVGSGGLLTDFSISDQFLDKFPDAKLTVHLVDTDYVPYLRLLEFCKGQSFLSSEAIKYALEGGAKSFIGGMPIQLGWSLENEKSTMKYSLEQFPPIPEFDDNEKRMEFIKKNTERLDKENILIRSEMMDVGFKLCGPHERFQRFFYLLKNRHPKATVKVFVWGSMPQLTESLNKREHKLDFIGSIDALGTHIELPANVDTEKEGMQDFEKLWSACASVTGESAQTFWLGLEGVVLLEKVNLVGSNDVYYNREIQSGYLLIKVLALISQKIPESLKGWDVEKLSDAAVAFKKEFKSEVVTVTIPGAFDINSKPLSYKSTKLPPEPEKLAREAIDGLK